MVASALLSLGPTSVFAADLSLTPPPPRAPLPVLFTWTGLYFGINGGYGWGRVNTVNQDGNTFSFNANGGLIGATLGFNYQWNWFVAGVEGDVDVSGMHWKQTSTGSSNAFLGLPQTATVTLFYKNTVLSTVAGRIGVAANRTLFYAKAGGAWTEEKYEFNGSEPVLGDLSGSNTINRLGWTVGAGVEYAVTNNIFLKAEYNYVDFGRINENFTINASAAGPAAASAAIGSKLTMNVVKVGVNWLFTERRR